jgi:solute carrier family 25 protein 38
MDSIFVHSISSFASASFATCLTHPFDVMKTRVQLDQVGYPTAFIALKRILKEEGWRRLFAGLIPRAGRKALGSAIVWTIYSEITGLKK